MVFYSFRNRGSGNVQWIGAGCYRQMLEGLGDWCVPITNLKRNSAACIGGESVLVLPAASGVRKLHPDKHR